MLKLSTSIQGMLDSTDKPMVLIEPKKVGKKSYVHSGHITAGRTSIEHHPSFSNVRRENKLIFKSLLYYAHISNK